MTAGIRVGVDIGGTFTDVVVRRPGSAAQILKIPTTRGDPSVAVLRAVEQLREAQGIEASAIERFLHGTTVATNAVLERKGARVGLLSTTGFSDVIEIGRQMRHKMYDLTLDPETPVFLAPGRFRREVQERIGSEGEVLTALNEASVARAADELAAAGCQAIAIAFLFSFLNDTHERRARDIVLLRHPTLLVSISSEVDPAFREYERTVVTAFDAYIKPVVDRYLANLESGLAKAGVEAPLQIMQSRGGVAGAATARLRPVRLFLSGPAAGVIGGRMAAENSGIADVITVDVGGTSSDIALIEGGRPALKSEGTIEGYPVRVAMVDVNTIGSGGGSIAWIDKGGGLRVGPEFGWLGARTSLLRSWRRARDGHRCLGRTRLHRSRLLCQRSDYPVARGSLSGDRSDGCEATWTVGRGGGTRHSSRRQCADGGGHPTGLYTPGARSAALRVAAARRRRPTARLPAGGGSGHWPDHRLAAPRRLVCGGLAGCPNRA